MTQCVAPSAASFQGRNWPLLSLGFIGLLLGSRYLQAADSTGASSTSADEAFQISTVVVQAPWFGGPGVSPSGSSDYGVTEQDISHLPAGTNSQLSDVLAQMPGVAIDQNQQIHIRNTEGPQFQYQINGVLIPLDINTNPPFLSMINPMFISRIDLLTGVLPSRYSYATGGVVNIETKRGCDAPGGDLSIFAGQRDTVQPSVEYRGCNDQFSYYLSGLYSQSNTAFSSATPGPNAYHNRANSGQTFDMFTYDLDHATKVSLMVAAAGSDNQLPNVPGLAPQFTLAGPPGPLSQAIDSYLNFRDTLVVAALNSAPVENVAIQVAYSFHTISQAFQPDNAGELIYQGVSSTSTHRDIDNTLQADVTYRAGAHTVGAGFYFGGYSAHVDDSSLVFPVNGSGAQTSSVPLSIMNNTKALNVVSGIYVNDLWKFDERLSADVGLREDQVTGFTSGSQIDPTLNLSYKVTSDATVHGGFARYFQVPIFQGISPTAPAAFAGTTAGGPPGVVSPFTEDDYVWDVGWVQRVTAHLTLSEDNYYELTRHYLDTGQFGVVPIFAPFNYDHGDIWGSEIGVSYKRETLTAYTNITIGRNVQKGVATGQFNFDPTELGYIDSHSIVLDHQPLVGVSAGLTWDWRSYSFSADGNFSSGLRGGFADEEQLPKVLQFNVSAQRSFTIPGVGKVVNRVTVLNVLDRVNLIRPAEGIGIFQSAYGPRFTVYDTLTIPF